MASSRLKLLDACLKKYAKQKRNEKFQFQRMDRPPERLQSLKSFNQNICSMNAPGLRLIQDFGFRAKFIYSMSSRKSEIYTHRRFTIVAYCTCLIVEHVKHFGYSTGTLRLQASKGFLRSTVSLSTHLIALSIFPVSCYKLIDSYYR